MKKSIIDELKEYDRLDFNEGESPITNTEYDLLKSKAKEEDPNNPYFSTIGHPVSKFEAIKLPFIMGGLEEFNPATVSTWLEKVSDDIVVSEKLDGNSFGCSFRHSYLTFAASRGDGYEGQNIINKIWYALRHPLNHTIYHKDSKPNIPENISMRGEIFLKGNIHLELGKKNRRNCVTGLLRRDKIIPEILSKLSVSFYELVSADEKYFETETERLLYIKSQGFEIVRYMVLPKDLPTQQKIEVLVDYLAHLKETAN
jgi:NAD-dependent DNA ligase